VVAATLAGCVEKDSAEDADDIAGAATY